MHLSWKQKRPSNVYLCISADSPDLHVQREERASPKDYRNSAPSKPHPFGIASKISLGLRGEFSNTSSPHRNVLLIWKTLAQKPMCSFFRISAYHVSRGESIIFAVRTEHASVNLMMWYRQISK
ncbi:hypothetical protein NPIL_19671 [Nephila pilipes]|uniref:Uncharacterized protein n=1 Tax=Nephila pilipes TaxID=299642 RepID=A0A8X6U0K6_NEPPI|nr:hypothetical protein NPIL_19671 [Nephila pilipes]